MKRLSPPTPGSAKGATEHHGSVSNLQRDHILRDILTHIEADEYKHHVDPEPLKHEVIESVLRNEFDPGVQIRGLLHAIRHTLAFKSALHSLAQPELRNQIEAFLDGKTAQEVIAGKDLKLPCSHSLHHPTATKKTQPSSAGWPVLDTLKSILLRILNVKSLVTRFLWGETKPQTLPQIWEDEFNSKSLEVHVQNDFENWVHTVKNTPKYTFLPTTVLGVQNLVRWSASNNLRVHCAGYRHSWSPISSQGSDVLVSFVNLTQVTSMPDPMCMQPVDYTGVAGPNTSELKTIEMKEQLGPKKRLCRIGVTRGIQNMRVRDTEFQIPIPARKDDQSRPDFAVVKRAWWEAIRLVYEYGGNDEAPMRLALELRIMSGSDVLMAPQYGNGPWGTASIEVLTIPDADRDGEWAGYVQRMSDVWMSYTDSDGAKLNVRPHWAKEWDGFHLGGMDARKYLKTVAYKDQIPKFRSALVEIEKGQGWRLAELKNRFSNELWDELVFE